MSWEYMKLSEVAEFKNGVNFNKSSFGLGMKVINVGDFKDKLYPNYLTLPQINPDGVVKESDLLKNGDILFVRSNGNKELVGRSMFIDKIDEPITFSGFCIRCRFKSDKVYPLFYAYLFKSQIIRNTISNSANGANITNLNQTLLNNLKVPKITISTQKRIASILSNYDDLIENNIKRINLLEETAQNIYKEWFVNFRFPNYEHTEFDAESGLPNGWKIKNINEIYNIKYGKNLPTTKITSIGNFPVYGASGIMGYYSEKNVSQKVALISSRGSAGKIHRTYEKESFITNNSFIVTPTNEYSHIPFFYIFESLKLLNLKSYCGGVAIPQLTNSALNNINILVPEKSVIMCYDNIIEPIYKQIDLLYNQNHKLKEARDILLPRLMNRTIEV